MQVEGIDRNDGSVVGKECVIKGCNELSSEENLYGRVAEASLGRVGSDDLLAVSSVRVDAIHDIPGDTAYRQSPHASFCWWSSHSRHWRIKKKCGIVVSLVMDTYG
jgi:hypothetical protein